MSRSGDCRPIYVGRALAAAGFSIKDVEYIAGNGEHASRSAAKKPRGYRFRERSPHALKNSVQALVAFAISLLWVPVAAIQGSDKVYVNGDVVTMDDRGNVAEAVRVGEDGRIVAVGKSADLLKAAGTAAEVIDLHGAHVVAGILRGARSFSSLGGAEAGFRRPE